MASGSLAVSVGREEQYGSLVMTTATTAAAAAAAVRGVDAPPASRDALPAHLRALEAEAIHILREAIAEARNPVLLFSGGKDSTVLAHLAVRAFFPAPPPLPLLHIDSTWEF